MKSISQSVIQSTIYSINQSTNQPINQYYKATVIVIVTVKSNVYCLMIEYAFWNVKIANDKKRYTNSDE